MAFYREPSYSTASHTGICYSRPSATSAGAGATSNTTAERRHYVEDVVRRPIEREAEQGRPSALPTREQQPIGVLAVAGATQRGPGSAQRSNRP